ncbi:alpha/beta hydrolase [Actinorhabdospora filicis]|uniref:Alpha/beta hydrolase n=1 Tax=Actinorhabdospora filicis TaxID=1785913 RepID=A0A9W6SIR6_9ACTN|nr:alpha/beta hydrolase [Actinorhabdospora filicis]GLZ76577.1 alpha/beta hydrolase [Actinorhabdospora filicis]
MSEEPKASKAKKAGIIGAIVGLAAAGIAAGVGTQRYLVKRARKAEDDPYADEPFGILPYDTTATVTTTDGVKLYAEIEGAADAPLTAIFVHGFCLDMGTFHFQRRALTAAKLPVRAVYYDQPGHGRSDALPIPEYDIETLGASLGELIDAVAPKGPLVLIGHSMGAMTIMALAEQRPELFAERVKGVALLSTSSGGLSEVSFGFPKVISQLRRPLLPLVTGAARMTPSMIDRARRAAGDVAWLLTRRYGFGTAKPSPSVVSYVELMNTATPMQTVAGYLKTLMTHAREASLPVFSGGDVLIIGGAKDLFTPVTHTHRLAELMPQARLVVLPEAGHVAPLEFPDEVSGPLLAQLHRISEAVTAGPVKKLFSRRRKKSDQ